MCVRACMQVHVPLCVSLCVRAHACPCVYVCVCVCAHTRGQTCMPLCACVCAYPCPRECLCACRCELQVAPSPCSSDCVLEPPVPPPPAEEEGPVNEVFVNTSQGAILLVNHKPISQMKSIHNLESGFVPCLRSMLLLLLFYFHPIMPHAVSSLSISDPPRYPSTPPPR